MIKLIVALGNPGREYATTRHNIGWMAIENLSYINNLNWKSKFKGLYATKSIDGENRYFLLPQTFMNLSGESVQKLMAFFKIQSNEVLVVHDEVDLKFGDLVFKKGGGFGGHNGLKSIGQSLGTKDFLRLRLGVDRPQYGDMSSHVLSTFTSDEEISLDRFLPAAAQAIELCLEKGFEKAAGEFSKKNYV